MCEKGVVTRPRKRGIPRSIASACLGWSDRHTRLAPHVSHTKLKLLKAQRSELVVQTWFRGVSWSRWTIIALQRTLHEIRERHGRQIHGQTGLKAVAVQQGA